MDTTGTTTEITVGDLAKWLGAQTWSDFAQSLASFYSRNGYLTPRQDAAARKMYAKVMAKKGTVTSTPEYVLDTDGIYMKDGEVYKVQWNQTRTKLYAKMLVVTTKDDGTSRGRFVYVGRKPLYTLTEDDRLTFEKAKDFGALYGMCVSCTRTLTNEDSVYNGYGEICAHNHGWPYRKAPEVWLSA